ncbi:hypothetical protein CDL62_14700 [Alkalitalea saponilacus]|nr:hypothetical protein CDL62_14700 [Alkalitalea saponilacus]
MGKNNSFKNFGSGLACGIFKCVVCGWAFARSLSIKHNGDIYEMLGLRCASLSAVTKAGAGQKGSCKHQNPNILYMMLPFRCLFLQVIYFYLNSLSVTLWCNWCNYGAIL